MTWISRYIAARRRRKAIEASMPMILDFMDWQANLYRRPESPEEVVAIVMKQMNRHRQDR
jgi:hypothetical protein